MISDLLPDPKAPIMNSFSDLVNKAGKSKKDPHGREMVSTILKKDYQALTNNCTTKTIDGVSVGNNKLGSKLSNPKESKGRGLGIMEKFAAGDSVGSKIFMPADLQVNIENDGSYYKKNIYNKD